MGAHEGDVDAAELGEPVNPRKRISSLLRELADAFDDLEREDQPKKPRRRLAAVPSEAAQNDMVDRVRSTLRKQGIVS